MEVLNPEEHKNWSPFMYCARPLRLSKKVQPAFDKTISSKNKQKIVLKFKLLLILEGLCMSLTVKVEKDSLIIIPFNPTNPKHRDPTTSISAP